MTLSDTSNAKLVLSVDAMGGDEGPAPIVAGLARFIAQNADVHVLLHGPEGDLKPLVSKKKIEKSVTIVDAPDIVTMSDKPSHVMRHGKSTSMWSAIESVRSKDASVCVSCGNTGALMAVSMIRLRKAEGVNRPAIACLWPSRNPAGFNVMLDAGADIRADEEDLLTYALMGASYAPQRAWAIHTTCRAELKVAHDMIGKAAPRGDFEYVGFVEGGDLPSARVDVIVTDGFTGNVALKTGEGTANFISESLRAAFKATPFSRIAALLAATSLGRLKKKIDPRRVNGGVFLGLNGTVIKSHGSADATGVEAALVLAAQLGRSGFSDKLAARVASAAVLAQDDSAIPKDAPTT
ncbi:Phosphate acyltransferase [Nymphon striatum]|nr:Phosphate acyltransferase [Nymphon striatum]